MSGHLTSLQRAEESGSRETWKKKRSKGMSIGWNSELATGVDAIDNQHKEIFNRVNKLSAACAEGKGKEEVLRLLLFLEDYIKEHFAAEEKLQMRSAYPNYADHKSQHQQFMGDVARLAAEFKAEGATLSLVIMTNKLLTHWLVQHITKVDKQFANFLKAENG
jgi:hemerythrin